MTHTHSLTVEFDRDGNRIYAWLETNGGEVIQDFDTDAELDSLIAQSELIDANGRWDGETSTKLCPEYEGRACTTGGTQEIYGLNYFDHASVKEVG